MTSIKNQTAVLITIILMGLFLLFAPPSDAQTVTLTDLPFDTTNTRFFSDEYPIHHPSLSLNGFDCDRRNCDEGLGLKQVLEEVYNIQNSGVADVYDRLVFESTRPIDPPSSHGDVWNNTVRLQSRGFVALASYILERNGNDPTALTPALPPSSQAIADFLAPLVDASLWMIDGGKETDGVKWATPTTNVARAMDFYLALENAYAHFDSVEYNNQYATTILSKSEKDDLLTDYTLLIDAAEQYGGEYNGYVGVDGYDYQAGNWPLKVQLAIGYAILTWQNSNNDDCSFNYFCDFNGWLERAFKAAGQHSGNDRYNYWRYQVDDGKDFWAEGPYYHHLTLSQVIPFWHAARINDLLSNTAITGYTISGDPFFEDWFVRPLSWLADLATPDGKTPPLDDGNKQVMYNASLLRWTGAYGDGSVGQKFAWISNIASRPSMLPVEIAIPRQSTPTSNPLPEVIGNTSSGQTGESGRQEVVVRRRIAGMDHYVLLNGESGDAIRRGEGHEQGDQLQLLYYVDDFSYLLDSGYDRPLVTPPSWSSSTWNHYYDHNAMTLLPHPGDGIYADGGVKPPHVAETLFRIVSEHQNIDAIHRDTRGKIDVISGQMTLNAWDLAGYYKAFADYYRTVLFIGDPQHPYLIDINAASNYRHPSSTTGNFYHTLYRGNSNSTTEIQESENYAVRWNGMYYSESTLTPASNPNHDLFIQPFTVERPLHFAVELDQAREPFINAARGEALDVKLLRIDGKDAEGEVIPDFTTVAFIQALPDGEPTPGLADAHRTPSDLNPLGWQYFTWQHSSSVIDVLVTRAAVAYALPSIRTDIDVAIAEAANFRLHLPKFENYGFIRLIDQGDTWSADSQFTLNLVPCFGSRTFSANETIPSDIAICDGEPVSIDDQVTTTFDGDVLLRPGAQLLLGENAKAVFRDNVSSAGTSADPVLIGRTAGASQYSTAYVELAGEQSSMIHTDFDGGSKDSPRLVIRDDAALTIGEGFVANGQVYVRTGGMLTVSSGETVTMNHYTFVEDTGTLFVEPNAIVYKDGYIKIEPGAVMDVREGATFYLTSASDILADGHLDVTGTEANPVVFRQQGAYNWPKVMYRGASSSGIFTHAELYDADYGVMVSSADNIDINNVYVDGGDGSSNITFYFSSGIRVWGGRFLESQQGAYAYSSSVQFVTDNYFQNASGAGIRADASSSLNFGDWGQPAYVYSTGNLYGAYASDNSSMGLGIVDGYQTRGGQNSIFGNSDCELKVTTSSGIGAEETWWGQSPPSSSEFCSDSGYGINNDPWLDQPPSFPSGVSYLIIDHTAPPATSANLSKAEIEEASKPTSTSDAVTPAAFVREIRRIQTSEGRVAAANILRSYADEIGHPLARLASLLLTEDLLVTGRYDEAVRTGTELLRSEALTRDQENYVRSILFTSYLNGYGNQDAAEGELIKMEANGADSSLTRLMRELLRTPLPTAALRKAAIQGGMETSEAKTSSSSNDLTVSAYPNPFNPSTIIEFSLPEEAHVQLRIYDMMGREVKTLLDDKMSAGTHRAFFNASNLASGVYLYRLTTLGRTETGKVLLMK